MVAMLAQDLLWDNLAFSEKRKIHHKQIGSAVTVMVCGRVQSLSGLLCTQSQRRLRCAVCRSWCCFGRSQWRSCRGTRLPSCAVCHGRLAARFG
jgi:hypothetical protein